MGSEGFVCAPCRGRDLKPVTDGLAPNHAGLYQFNATVRNISDDNLAHLSGTAGSQTLYLPVKR